MAGNVFTYQVLKDTTEKTVIKLTGSFDGTGGQESNTRRIVANTLYGALDSSKANLLASSANTGPLPYYGLAIHRLWYDCVNPNAADVELFYNGDTTQTIAFLSGTYEYDAAQNWITFGPANPAAANVKGDIGIRTRGMGANCSYTIIVELRKDNAMYQRGQITDPAGWNYGPYSVSP
jgi:hypothetical protein